MRMDEKTYNFTQFPSIARQQGFVHAAKKDLETAIPRIDKCIEGILMGLVGVGALTLAVTSLPYAAYLRIKEKENE